MSSRDVFRVAPSQLGKRAANIWRFWHRGDEFYAGCRDAIRATKLSFHRDGNWQIRVGVAVEKLTVSRILFDNWLHVISLHWLLWAGAFRPISTGKEDVALTEVPEHSKLVVNLLLSLSKGDPPTPKPSEGGYILWRTKLRNRRIILLHVVTLPQTEQDRRVLERLRLEASIPVQEMPAPEKFYAEIARFASRAESGNTVAIVPLGPDSLKVRA